MNNQQLYDQDFHARANEQAGLLRARLLSEADIEHIAEEIESMGKSEKRELVNRLTVALMHSLIGRHPPVHRGKNGRLALEERRNRREDRLGDIPTLKSGLGEPIVAAYRKANWARVGRQAWNAPCCPSPALGVSSR